jgi:hypothetical protein
MTIIEDLISKLSLTSRFEIYELECGSEVKNA